MITLYFHKTDLKYNDNLKWLLSLTLNFELELELCYKDYPPVLSLANLSKTNSDSERASKNYSLKAEYYE